MVSLKRVYDKTNQSIKSNPVLLVPFAIFAACEFIVLIIAYLAPRMPLKLLLGPPIRALWGERFLHYPINFILIPKLVSLARIGLTVLIGSLLTGVTTLLVYKLFKKSKPSLKNAFKASFKKYISLFGIILLFTLIFYFLDKVTSKILLKYFISGHTKLLFLSAKLWLGPILMGINFIFAVIVQSAFIYAIPVLLIEEKSLTKSVIKSFALFKRLFLKTVILVGLPMLLYIPIVVLQSDSAFL
ncbi:MAG: hypothetical protein WC543_06635, partial [Candidatus Omnitrophota bacterium]